MSVKKVATFKERLIYALDAKNMTQSDLGRAIGVERSSINKYVKGTTVPPLDRIHAMSAALEVCVPWLLGYNVPMN